MHPSWTICNLLIVTLFAYAQHAGSQTSVPETQGAPPYNLTVAVDEVILTFHAADAHGLPINDLKLDELSLLDNGKPPRKILAFQSLRNLPIHAAILMDTSESMQENLAGNRAISTKYALRLLRQQTDQAFVMKFRSLTEITQPWTSDATALASGIRKSAPDAGSSTRGTAIFDAIYRACLNQFGHIDHGGSGNFILLFSDGEDNASNTSLKQAVDLCQHTNTAIYAFRPAPKSSLYSPGLKTLAELASESGGRVFRAGDTETEIDDDLSTIESDLRNQYRLIYRPMELRHDGSFHRIQVKVPERVDSINIRSGYYAPVR